MTSSRTASVFRGGSDNHVLQMRKDEGSLASCGSPTPYDIDSPRRKYKSFNEMHNHPLAASGHHLSDSGTIPKRPVWGEQDRDSSWDNSSSSLLTDLKVLTDTFAKNKRFQYAHIVPVLSVLAGLAVLVSVWGLVDRVLHSMQSHEEVPPIDVSAVTLSGAQLHAILEETRKEAVRGYGVHPYPVYLVPVLQVVLAGVFLLLLVVMQRAEGEVREGVAQDRALLRQLLPPVIIQAIHLGDHISIWHPDATFCFTDIVGFTRWSSAATPARVVSVLDRLFAIFDELALQHGVFKIKTMGDAYMGVAGINGNDDIEHAMSVLKVCCYLFVCMQKMTQHSGASTSSQPLEATAQPNSVMYDCLSCLFIHNTTGARKHQSRCRNRPCRVGCDREDKARVRLLGRHGEHGVAYGDVRDGQQDQLRGVHTRARPGRV